MEDLEGFYQVIVHNSTIKNTMVVFVHSCYARSHEEAAGKALKDAKKTYPTPYNFNHQVLQTIFWNGPVVVTDVFGNKYKVSAKIEEL